MRLLPCRKSDYIKTRKYISSLSYKKRLFMRNIAKSLKKGFTLIELMIVIGIIGILAIIATAQYNTYIARSQLTEGINIAGGSKSYVAEFIATNGRFPTQAEFNQIYPIASNLSSQTKYIQNIILLIGNTGNLVIHIQFKNSGVSSQIAGKYLLYRTPAVGLPGSGEKWVCQLYLIDKEIAPTACQNSPADI